jgi:hypothetical protein
MSLVVRAKKIYRSLRRYELEGWNWIVVLGFVPIPAPHFKRKRTRTRSRSSRTIVKRVAQPKDPIADTLESYRQDAISEGKYDYAFGTAIAQMWYENSKKVNQPSA